MISIGMLLLGRGISSTSTTEIRTVKSLVIFMIFFAAGLTSFIGFLFLSEDYEKEDMEEVEISSDDRRLLAKWSAVIAIDIIGGSFISNFLSYWFYLKFKVGLGMIGTLFGASRLLAVFSYYLGFWMSMRGFLKKMVIMC